MKEIGTNDATTLAQIVEQSLARPEITVRGRSAEDMKKWL